MLRCSVEQIARSCSNAAGGKPGTIVSLRDADGRVLWANEAFDGMLVNAHASLPVKSYSTTLDPIAAAERLEHVDRVLTTKRPEYLYQIGADRVHLWGCVPVMLSDSRRPAVIASCTPDRYRPGTLPMMQTACMDQMCELSLGQRRILLQLLKGMTDGHIAQHVSCTCATVTEQIGVIANTLGVAGRYGLQMWGLARDLDSIPDDIWDELLPVGVYRC